MCDTTAFLVGRGSVNSRVGADSSEPLEEELLLENVDRVECQGDEIRLTSIFGEQKTLHARLRLFDNTAGKLILEALS